jgi:hypothetical protein
MAAKKAKATTSGRPATTAAPHRRTAAAQDAGEEYGTMEELDAFLDRLNARAEALLADIRQIAKKRELMDGGALAPRFMEIRSYHRAGLRSG